MSASLEGFLTKRGAVRKNWKKRWFVLAGASGAISYFANRFDAVPLATFSCRGCILVTDGTSAVPATTDTIDTIDAIMAGGKGGESTAGNLPVMLVTAASLLAVQDGASEAGSATPPDAAAAGAGESSEDGAKVQRTRGQAVSAIGLGGSSASSTSDSSIGGGVTARTRSALTSRSSFAGLGSRQNPNAFSVIVRTDGNTEADVDVVGDSTTAGKTVQTRRYIMAAPTRQLRLEWMIAIAGFCSRVAGEPDAIHELAAAMHERVRQRQFSIMARSSTLEEDAGNLEPMKPASEDFVKMIIAELDTFALDIPQHRQAVLVKCFRHIRARFMPEQMLTILSHLLFDDDRETCLILALEQERLSRDDVETLLNLDSTAPEAVLGPIERTLLEAWIPSHRTDPA